MHRTNDEDKEEGRTAEFRDRYTAPRYFPQVSSCKALSQPSTVFPVVIIFPRPGRSGLL